jgi:hypothetical protein
MDCQICHKELDEYTGGKPEDNMYDQVKAHPEICEECDQINRLRILADRVINFEKEIRPDNYLSSRIMALLEKEEERSYDGTSGFLKLLKPALITTSLAAAIFAGVMMGNIYKPSSGQLSRPVEFALIDDDAIESVYVLSNQ